MIPIIVIMIKILTMSFSKKKKKKKILTMTVEMIEAITKMKSHLIPLNPPLNQKLKQNLLA